MINSKKKRCGNKQKFNTNIRGITTMNKKTIAILGTAVLVLSLASVSLAGPMGGGMGMGGGRGMGGGKGPGRGGFGGGAGGCNRF